MTTYTLTVLLVLLFFSFVLPTIAIWMDDAEWHRDLKH